MSPEHVFAAVCGIVIFSIGFVTGAWWSTRPLDPNDPDTAGRAREPLPQLNESALADLGDR